jgi:prophage DNA circulation protein
MNWQNKIRQGKYTSPGGAEIIFGYEKGSRDTELKTGTYTFPSRNGASVQHQGAGAVTFPITAIFSGESCMDEADAFEAALIETETGELQHPVYGTIKVKPVGDIKREDDLISTLNESRVTVTFTQHITDDEEVVEEVTADSIEESEDAYTEAAAEDFAESIAAATPEATLGDGFSEDPLAENITEKAQIQEALEAQTQAIIDGLKPLAATDKEALIEYLTSAQELKSQIQGLYQKGTSLSGKVESLFVKALNVARLTLRLMKLPSRLAVSLSQKIQGYSMLAATLINQFGSALGAEGTSGVFAIARLGLTAAAASIAAGAAISTAESAAAPPAARRAASVYASVSAGGAAGTDTAVDKTTGTASREDAIESSSRIMELLETITAFEDRQTTQGAFVDSNSAAYMALAQVVYQSARLIRDAAFALPMQRTFTLDRDRQVIELCAELYGSTDYLDDFILQNNFTIDEIELLPMGTRVTYYVKNA